MKNTQKKDTLFPAVAGLPIRLTRTEVQNSPLLQAWLVMWDADAVDRIENPATDTVVMACLEIQGGDTLQKEKLLQSVQEKSTEEEVSQVSLLIETIRHATGRPSHALA